MLWYQVLTGDWRLIVFSLKGMFGAAVATLGVLDSFLLVQASGVGVSGVEVGLAGQAVGR